MTILDCLKTSGSRLDYGNKSLLITNKGLYRVFEYPVLLLETDNEEKAVEELMR